MYFQGPTWTPQIRVRTDLFIFWKITQIFITHCSAHRKPTKMVQVSLQLYLGVVCEPSNWHSKFKKIFGKLGENGRKCFKTFFFKLLQLCSWIVLPTDYPQKWFCTFWYCQDNTILEINGPFCWVSCVLTQDLWKHKRLSWPRLNPTNWN